MWNKVGHGVQNRVVGLKIPNSRHNIKATLMLKLKIIKTKNFALTMQK